MRRYIFEYVAERTRGGEVVHRPIVHLHVRSGGGEWYLFYPYVDSGADISLLTRSDCGLLGLKLREGAYRPVLGIGRIEIPAYVYEVPVRIGDEEFQVRIAFADSNEVPRVLGRSEIFRRFRITFDEVDLKTVFEVMP
ncbi:MAG: hypothetical protein QMD10_10565 [Desulfitobacteriaceae bacterium]|nr:hypothetical protein [Desulfitobacteriaceae bacterium]